MSDKTQTITVKSTADLKKHYTAAVHYLDDNYAFFLTHVLKIGKPKWTYEIPTAAVSIKLNQAINAKDSEIDYDDFEFIFSPVFASSLNTEVMAFVMAHETMHILLNHLRLAGNFVNRDVLRKANAKKRNGERLTRDEIRDALVENQNAKRFNIAADCVINDYLINAGMPAFDGCMRGQDKVGMDCSYLTVTEVYDMLKQQAQENKKKKGKGEGSGMPGSGEPGDPGESDEDTVGGTYEEMDNHDWMLDPDFAEKMADALDKLQDEVSDKAGLPGDLQDKIDEEDGKQTQASKDLNNSMKPGTEEGNLQKFQQQMGIELAWAKLLREVDPNMFKEPGLAPPQVPSFHARRRKLGSPALKRVSLPIYRTEQRREDKVKQKPAIVMALDTSGSIGPRDAERFVSLAMTIPQERIKLFCCTFTTTYKPLDLENPQYNGGGTDFTAIGQYIEDVVKPELKGDYPTAVVVVTDGEASMQQHVWPDEKQAKGWFWLISPQDRARGVYRPSLDIGRRAMLDEYMA